MIHLTVAQPMGIDSVFFSFIQRLALQNGHCCVDPPAQHLDEPEPGAWMEGMKNSNLHYFVIGYRYPPDYWKALAENSTTLCLLADPDGMARQVESIQKTITQDSMGADADPTTVNWLQSIDIIRTALDTTVELAEWILSTRTTPTQIIPHASAFLLYSKAAFQRLESFYHQTGVPIHTSCWKSFSEEAHPFMMQLSPPIESIRRELHRLLMLKDATPEKLEALAILFG